MEISTSDYQIKNQRKRWDIDDAKLEMLARNDMLITTIAENLGRTKAACQKRLQQMKISYKGMGMPNELFHDMMPPKCGKLIPRHKDGQKVNYTNYPLQPK